MIKFIHKTCPFLIYILFLLIFSGCNYHPKTSFARSYQGPNYAPFPSEDFVMIPPSIKRISPRSPIPIMKKKVIVIDAGHGGDDLGTRSSSKPKYHEKSLNLTTAIALNDFLEKMGYQTIMTRKKDEFIALQKRADFANENEADLFVSVHYNSAPTDQAEGIEIFYYKSDDNKSRTSESYKLATVILAQLIKLTEAKSRGVKHGNFAVIRETKMPAVLIEGGFLTNEEEMEKIKDPTYVKNVAWGIALGIQAYLEKR